MKGTGAKRNFCPGSCVSTGAKFPVAPVESAPMEMHIRQRLLPKRVGRANCLPTGVRASTGTLVVLLVGCSPRWRSTLVEAQVNDVPPCLNEVAAACVQNALASLLPSACKSVFTSLHFIYHTEVQLKRTCIQCLVGLLHTLQKCTID